MLAWFRTYATAVAVTALVVFAVGSGVVASHALHAADAAPVAFEHDATAHGMSAAATAPVDGHRLDCLACSWTRSLRQRPAVAVIVVPTADAGRVVHARVFTARCSVLAAQPPLRSPPRSPDPGVVPPARGADTAVARFPEIRSCLCTAVCGRAPPSCSRVLRTPPLPLPRLPSRCQASCSIRSRVNHCQKLSCSSKSSRARRLPMATADSRSRTSRRAPTTCSC